MKKYMVCEKFFVNGNVSISKPIESIYKKSFCQNLKKYSFHCNVFNSYDKADKYYKELSNFFNITYRERGV